MYYYRSVVPEPGQGPLLGYRNTGTLRMCSGRFRFCVRVGDESPTPLLRSKEGCCIALDCTCVLKGVQRRTVPLRPCRRGRYRLPCGCAALEVVGLYPPHPLLCSRPNCLRLPATLVLLS